MKMRRSLKEHQGLSADALRAIAEYDGPITKIPRGVSAFDYSQKTPIKEHRRRMSSAQGRQIKFMALNRRQEPKQEPRPRPDPPPRPAPRRDLYLKLARQGFTVRQIAETMGVKISTARKVLLANDIAVTTVSEQRRQQLESLVSAGKMVPEIAKAMGSHRNEIYRLMRKYGLRAAGMAPPGCARDKRKYDRLRKLATSGHNAREIAAHFGIDRSQVYRMAQYLKIKLPTKGKGSPK